jgi:hypothetical protein
MLYQFGIACLVGFWCSDWCFCFATREDFVVVGQTRGHNERMGIATSGAAEYFSVVLLCAAGKQLRRFYGEKECDEKE